MPDNGFEQSEAAAIEIITLENELKKCDAFRCDSPRYDMSLLVGTAFENGDTSSVYIQDR